MSIFLCKRKPQDRVISVAEPDLPMGWTVKQWNFQPQGQIVRAAHLRTIIVNPTDYHQLPMKQVQHLIRARLRFVRRKGWLNRWGYRSESEGWIRRVLHWAAITK